MSTEQALAICCEIGAVNYVETSAKCPDNNAEAFELAALAAIKARQARQRVQAANNQTSKSHHFKKNWLARSASHSHTTIPLGSV